MQLLQGMLSVRHIRRSAKRVFGKSSVTSVVRDTCGALIIGARQGRYAKVWPATRWCRLGIKGSGFVGLVKSQKVAFLFLYRG